MKILVVNAGSSSLKFQLIDMQTETMLCKGACEKIGIEKSFLTYKKDDKTTVIEKDLPNHKVAMELTLSILTDPKLGVIKDLKEIFAIGHRVLHGAEKYKNAVVIDEKVMADIKNNIDLGPLHMPANLLGIEACRNTIKGVPNIAVFDTAFHANMPKESFLYALPLEIYEKYKIRKYGFHGTSHQFVAEEYARLVKKDLKSLKIITCHLGNGSSISAIKDGVSIDTTMGYTPLAGVIMGTRSGDIDPSICEALMTKLNLNPSDLTNYLNKKCGLAGITGGTSDMRDITNEYDTNARAKLAYDMLNYSVLKYVGAYIAALGGVDAILFTGGIGENSPKLRQYILDKLSYLGVNYDSHINETMGRGTLHQLSTKESKIDIWVIPTNEELSIARQTKNILANQK